MHKNHRTCLFVPASSTPRQVNYTPRFFVLIAISCLAQFLVCGRTRWRNGGPSAEKLGVGNIDYRRWLHRDQRSRGRGLAPAAGPPECGRLKCWQPFGERQVDRQGPANGSRRDQDRPGRTSLPHLRRFRHSEPGTNRARVRKSSRTGQFREHGESQRGRMASLSKTSARKARWMWRA